MPTIQNTTRGQVVQIWGKAYIRGTDGVWRPLTVGEVVPQGTDILTEQNSIVMMTRDEVAVPKVTEPSVDRAIAAVENNEEPPAAGLQGGGSGDLQPGLRIDRIVELVTPASIDTRLDATSVEFGRATQSDPGASPLGEPRLVAASSSISSVEEGSSVNLGLRAPGGSGTLTITVTTLPTIGQVFTAAGAPVVAGTVLTADELAGLAYRPPADYTAGTPVGSFGYSVSNGVDTAEGSTRIAVRPVNDAPVAIDNSNSGAEDILLDVALRGTDIDGTIASVTVRTLPANGALLLADTLAPVAVGAVLTPAQAASLVFRPNANWNGSTSFTFTVTDNEGAVSVAATITLTVTPVNDPPLAVNDTASTVAQAPVTVAVLGNDSDADNDTLTVTSANVAAALGSVVVNGDGTLSFTAAPGVTGPVVISYSISDPSGATSTATLTVNVAATPTVTVDAPALTNDRTPTLTGTSNLPPGSTVTLTVTDFNGVVQTFTTTVRPDGTYSVDVPNALAEGAYTAVANISGPGGTTATANDNGVVDITPPIITVDAPALTNDTTPALTGTTDLPAGATITLTVTGANGVTQLFTTTVQAGGVFSIDVPAALVSGPFSVSARGTDAAGNSATATDNGVVDNVPPTITVDAPALTNDTTPPLTGTTDLPVGATVTLTVTGANSAVQTFTTTVQTGGTFSVSVPASLVEGNFSVTASGTDAAGNTATASDNGVIDSIAPTVTVDAPALTNDTTPPLTGTTNLPAGSTVSLTVTGANGAVQTFTATVQTGGTFSVDVPAALVQGNFSVTATATDAAGNSASATDTGVIDTTPPVATLAIDPVTADNIVNAGEASGDITITGTVGGDVRVGDTVTLNVNGVAYTGLVLTGNTFAISVPGAGVLADADRRIDGSVTTTDNAGNSATATAQRPYAVNSAPIAVNDTLSIGEDTPVAGSDVTPGTAAQDRDADGDTLTVIGVVTGVQPSAAGNVNSPLVGTWGTLLLDGFGAYTYAPSAAAQAIDPGQTVSDTFTYTISDGRGGSATATLTISVVGANDPTTISGVFIGTVSEDAVATASGTLTNNDPDVGTRAFTVQTNSAGAYGRFSIDAAGDWTYTLSNAAANVQALAQGQSVSETFIVATDDGTTASITVTVDGANDAPVVSSTSISAVEEGAAVGLGLAVPSDIDNGAVLAITVTGLPTVGQVQLANGTPITNGATLTALQLAGLRYLPPAEYDGVAPVGTFAYSVSDGITSVNGGTTITVSAVNDRPVAIDSSASGFEDTTTRIAVTPAASDVDGTISSYTLASVPANGSLYAAATGGSPLVAGAVVTGPVYFQPNTNFNGSVSFNYTATDNGGAVSANTATATIVVNPVNDAPTLAGVVATFNYSEGSTPTILRTVIDGSVVLADIDSPDFNGGSVTVAIGNVVAAEDLLGIRNQGAADGQISVSGSNVSYNPVGAAVSVVIGTIAGGSGGAPLVVTLNANASVAAVDALLQNITYGNASQLPTTTPRNLTITVVDGDGTANGGADTVSTNVTVNITRVNDAPLFTALNGGVVNTTEGAAPVILDTNATVNDPELGSGFVGAINNMGGAVLTLARVGGANAQDQFSAGGGTLALTGGNVVLGGNIVGSYDNAALVNGTLQITFANGTTQVDATSVLRQIRYVNTSDTPPASVAIGYTVNDANTGSQGTGGARTGTATVTVNIAPVNDAPVAANDSETTSENTPLAASVPPAVDLDGTITSYALVAGVGAGNGALAFNSDGTFGFNPGGDFDTLSVGATRDVSFTYTATDNSGAVSNVATVTITVTGTNDGPVAFDAAQSTGENSTLAANVPAASDVDGTISSYALAGNVGANNGTLTFNADGRYSFATGADFDSLAAGQSRNVSFTYTATDNSGATSAPATVTITVTGANDAPTGSDATYTIAEDGSRAFAGADFGFADVDVGDTLARVRIDSLPTAGTLTLNGTAVSAGQSIDAAQLGNLVFTPAANANGANYASLTFSVQDSGGLFDAAPNTITLDVNAVNDPPLAVVTPASGDEDTPIAVSLTGTDIDGTIASVRVTALPGNGTLFLADGITPVAVNAALTPAQAASLVFVPAANFNGTVNVTFTVTDNSGATSAAAVTPISVAPVIDPAVSIDDVNVNEAAGTITFTVTLDQPTTANVSVNYATANGTATSGADYTALTGTVSFAPGVTTQLVTIDISDDAVFEGNENFQVVLSDAVNATIADNSGTGTITDNDTPTIAVSSPTVGEGGFAVFTVSLSNASTTAVTFNPTLASGTAAIGTDTGSALQYFNGTAWVAVPVGGVTLAAGTTSVQVRVATSDDFAAEGDEQFTLTATVTAGTTANASATGTATITDDSDVTTLTLSATPSAAEGGSIIYTATLDHAAVTPLAVTLSTGQIINIAAGTTSGSVTIAAPGEDPYLDAGTVSRSITSTTGGGFESLTVDGTAVTTAVTDTINTTTVSITGDAVVAEGATAAYTVSLTSAAQTAVTVNLTYSGVAADGSDFTGVATVTIPAGSSSAALNIATLQDTLAEGAESFTVTIGSAAGGNFENLVISSANGAAMTSITDDDTPALSVSSPSVGEGGFAVFTVSLSNPSTTAVTFNPSLASGTASVGTDTATALEYFNGTAWVAVTAAGVTLAAGDTSVQIRVATTDDFAAEGNEQFTLAATVTAGTTANASATGTATITDDVDATTVTLTATPSVAEGGSILYTATLDRSAVTPMTVTLSNGAVIAIAAGAISGSTPFAAPTDDAYIDAGSVSATIASTSGGGFEAVTIDPAAATTTVTDTINTTTATLTATPSVTEGGTITYTVSLTAPVTGSDVTLTLANGQTVTIAVGTSSGSVTAAAPDNVYGGGATVSNNIVSASGGNFEQLTPNTAPVTTTVTDDGDVTTVSLTATPSVVEGGNITYTATLTFAAQTPVSVTLSNGATITIAAGATSGSVLVAAPGDDPYIDASSVSATIATATGGNFESLQINPTAASTSVTDDVDPTTVSLSATPSVAEGGSIIYTATLTNAAQTAVIVTLSSGETITIAAGSTSGSVSVLAPAEDVYIDAGSVSRTIASATGGNFESLVVDPAAATTTVTDTINTTTVSITGDATVAEGATAAYTVSLTSAAQTAVTVNLIYSGTAADGSDFTGVATVTIAAGTSSANFNIATLQDVLAEGAESFTVTIGSAAGGNFESLVINGVNGAATTSITDDDTPALSVSSPTIGEGGFAVFTVSLSNPSTTAVTFNPALSSGTATVGTDTATSLEYFNGTAWVAVPAGGVTLAAGATSVQVRVATTDDFAAEGNEQFTLTATVTAGTTANASATGAATITDDVDTTTVTLTATPTIAEGGNILYTATLDQAAVTAMTVTLSSGQTIVIAAGATTGTVSIAAPGDDPYLDAGSVSRTIASTSGGGLEAVTINPAAATTAVSDTIDVTTATLTATPAVAEGGTITYTVSLDALVTGSPVTVTLANGQTITIAVGSSSAAATAVAADNTYAGGGSVSNNIASISGGNFEQLTPNTAPVTTTVTDDGDVTTVALSATASVVEGGNITYTATLSNAAQTPVSVTLANGATITIAAGATIGTTIVAAPGDDPYIDAGAVSTTIATATGGNFESLQINPAAASTSVTDDVDATTVSLTATPSVAEGGSIVYTATLTNAAQTPVTVTLSSGETITIAAGFSTGSVSIAAPGEDVYVDAGNVSRTITAAAGGNFESLAVNPAAATTTVSDTIDITTVSITGDASVAEGATAAYTVSLTSPAQTAVTVNLTYSGTAANGIDFTGVATITIAAGSSSALFNIATLQDLLGEGAENFTVSIGSAAGGNFESLVISGANGAATTSITDDDTPTISVSSPGVGEGGFAVFTVSLSNASTTAVSFNPTLASGTATVGTDTSTALEYFNGTAWIAVPVGGVTIAAGATSVQVRVATSDDSAAEGNESFNLTATVTAGTTANASATGTATISDDADATTVTLTATPSVAEGGNIIYTATLANAAFAPMTVTLSNGATIAIAAGATSGSSPVLAPTDDVVIDAGSVSATISSTAGGGFEAVSINPVAATTTITDTIDTTTATLTATPAVAEGGTITYTVSLDALVTGSPVSVTLANGQTIAIAVGQSSGSITTAVADNVYAGGGSVSNNIASVSGGNFEQLTPNTAPVTTTVTDDGDVTTVSLTATPSVVEGGNITYTATLTFAAQTPVSVTLSNGATITIAAGATSGSVLVAAPGDDPYIDASSVSATIATATGGNFESLQINPAAASTSVTDDVDPTTVSLSATPSVAEGGSIVYTATLTNAAQTPVTVTLSTGQTITIAAGFTSGSVSIAAPGEDVYVDVGSVSRTITSATGGNFESLAVNPAAATTTVSDTIDATTVSITGSAVVAEGATAAYTVSLTSAAQTAVTVNLIYSGTAADGSDFTGVTTVTIAAGTSSANFNIATLQDVLAEGAESFTVTIGSAAGGNFENLVISATNGTQTTSISDDDTPTLSVSSPTIGEGSFAVFTVSLSNPSTTAVTFNPALSSGTATVGTDTATALEYFNGTAWVAVPVGGVTIAAGATSAQVRVATSDDFAAEGSETFALTATVTSGNTGNASAVGTATITDDSDVTTVRLTATPSVAEGGQIIYTATLDHAAVTPLTVTLSSGQTIVIAAGATNASVSIAAPGDDPYLDAGSVSRTIASTSGGGFESLLIDGTAATTTVSDTIDVTTATLTATSSVAEGGTITYTVSLTAAVTGSAVNVLLANGQTVTIPVGASSASVDAIAPDNVYGGGASVANNIVSASGGNYEQLAPNTAPVTTAVNDDGDVTTVSLSATASVVEGTSITYTATLTNAAQTAVTVTLSNGATIAIAAGTTTGSVIVAAPGDDPYIDAGAVSATIATATGGNFESLQINPAAANTTVTDDSDPTTLNLSATASVAEGGSIVYTATLTNAAQTPLTVTLTGGTTITIAAGATSGSVSIAAPTEDVYLDAGSVSRAITATSGGNFENLQIGTASATTTVTDTIDVTTLSITGSGTVAEGATAGYTVSLTSPAQSAVTVNLSYSGTAANGSDYTGVASVVIAAGASSANFDITTLQDVIGEGAENFTVTIAGASGGNFESLVISGANGAQTTTITDDDTPTLAVSSPTVGEGGLAVFTVSLSNASTTAVVFNPTLASGTAMVGTDTATSLEYFNGSAWVAVPVGGVTLAAGSTSVQVRVATTDDFAAEGNEAFSLVATVTSGTTTNASATGTATITDDVDATTVTLTVSAASVVEGGSLTYTATVNNPVTGSPLVLTLSNGQTITIPVGQSSASGPVFLVRADDAYVQGTQTLAVGISSTSGANYEALTTTSTVSTTVTDDADVTTVTLTASAATVTEGGSITYTATVNNPVTGTPFIVTLSNGQTISIPVGQSSASSAAFAVRADDAYAQGTQTLTVGISSTSGANYEARTTTSTVSTTVTDDADATTVTLTASAATVSEGGSITYTGTVNNAVTGTPLVITLSNGQTITIPVGQSSATSAAFAVRADDAYAQGTQTLTVGISSTSGAGYEALTTTSTVSTTVTDDGDATTVTLTASAATVAEGGSITYTATVNNAVTGTPLVLTLSNGQTITIPVGQSSATSAAFAVRADDAYAQGTQTLTVGISTATGASYEALTTTSTVSTTVTDDADATTVTLTASAATVSEGGSITYTATVNNPVTGTPLVVTLSNGQTITIPVGQSSATSAAFAVRADDAYVQGAQMLTVGISSTTGAGYETLTTTSTVSTTVTDDADATIVTLTASAATVSEGGSITYTATVNNAVTGTPLVVTLSNGQTITIPVGQSSATSAAFAVRTDDAYAQGTQTLTVGISSTSGAGYEALTTTSTVSTTVTDDADATTVTLTSSAATVTEGGSITYTATVNNAVTGTPLVVTLSNGQTITIPVGQSSATSAAFAVRADDAYAQGTQTLTVGISSTSGASYEALTTTSTASTTVTDDADATTVTLTASAATVTEGGSITYTATVNNAVTGTPLVITLSNGQTITIPVGQSSATSAAFAVRADDAYVQGTQTLAVGISSTTGASYEALTTTSTASTTVTDDTDATTVTLTASAATVTEGGSITYTATVNNPVTGSPFVVTLSNGQTITIPVGQSSATSAAFAVRADDAYAQGTQTLTVGISSTSGANYEARNTSSTVSTTVTDDADATTVTLTASAATVTEGGSITYTATVNNAVTGTPLVITLSNGQTITIPVGQSSASSAAFAVRADDAYAQGTQTLTVGISSTSGANYEARTTTSTVSTTVTDDADTTTLSLTGSATVAEGASGAYTLTLTSPAQTAVTVNLSYTGTAANGADYTGVATVTIAAGASSATFNIATIDDNIDEVAAESFTVTVGTVTGGNFENLVVSGSNNSVTTSITDNDNAPTIAVSSQSVAEAGGFAVFTVSLSNPSSTATSVSLALANGVTNPATGGGADYGSATATNLQVSTDGGSTWTNATAATFAAGTTSLLVRTPITSDALDEADETFTLTATRTAGTTSNTSAVGTATITDDDATPSLAIGNVSVNESAGTMTFTVTLSAASGQNVTVNYGSSNGSATAGSDYTANSGTLTFAAGVTSQTITVAIADDSLTEASETLNVTLSAAANATISGTGIAIGTIIDNDTPPQGRDATVAATEDTPFVFGLANFLMNDAEQGNNVNPSSVRIDALPSNGSLFLNGVLVTAGQLVSAAAIGAGQLTFVPAANANGSNYANFTFSVRDASGQFDPAPNTITVNVAAVSDGAPDARNDLFQTTGTTPIVLTVAQLLSNDTLPDGATITSVSAVSGGTLVNNGNGTYTWTPSGPGSGTFNYTLTDQDGQTDTATVRIVSTAANDDLATVNESALADGTGAGTVTATGNLFANDSGNTTVNSITFNGSTVADGGAGDTDARAGYIGVNSTDGRLVVDSTGAGAGDYTYTLIDNANNSAVADDTSVTEVFSYDANAIDAALRVTVTDDAPQAISRTVQVSEDQVPSYRLVLVLDVSGSMDTATAGGEVRQVNADGSVTITTRLALARQALAQLVTEYYNQAQNVSITLVTFSDTATVVNNTPFTTKDAAVNAILAADGSGGTNYTNALTAVQGAFGTVNPSLRNAVYFVSDGAPSGGDLTTPATSTGYATFAANNNIDSYAVGIGTGIATTGPLNGIHNVDANGNGASDGAIIVPDLNDLGSALLSTVPLAYGGNVVSSSVDGNVLGADGGNITTVTIRLDTNGDGTRDTDVTFTRNTVTNQITSSSAFPAGFPITGDLLTLGATRGFPLGTLTFNFSTGDYTYFTGGTATEGDSFSFSFIARDGDGDITAPSTLTVQIADGHPVARPDTDTLTANQTRLEGNVISGLGTDGGQALGGTLTNFSPNGAGVDDAIDGAQVSSIVFKGVTYALGTAASGSGAGFTWSVAGGQLTWTATSGGERLVFATTGYYDYTPPTAALPVVTTAAAVTTQFNTAANADDNGVVLSGSSRTGTAQTVTHNNAGNNGAGVNGGGSNSRIDNLETLVVTFSSASHPQGVQGVSFVVNAAASNLGDNGLGTITSLTYTVFDIAGNELGQFYSTGENTVTIPAQYSNIGRIEIEANSAAEARITSVSFSSINVNTTAAAVAPVEISYTLTDTDTPVGDSSSATLTLRTMSNNLFGDSAANTLNGTNANDRIDGADGNDSLNGGAGNDLLIGGAGIDNLNGGDGIDELRGGNGNDILVGGNGNDILVGGMGNDALTGGAGADVFRWEFADRGVAGTPATDTIADFSTAQGDRLDLRDLLQGETLDGGAIGNLSNYLFVERVGANTVVHISSSGGFTSGYNSGAEDQTITLTGIDLTSTGALTSQQVIQDLLNNNRLSVDP